MLIFWCYKSKQNGKEKWKSKSQKMMNFTTPTRMISSIATYRRTHMCSKWYQIAASAMQQNSSMKLEKMASIPLRQASIAHLPSNKPTLLLYRLQACFVANLPSAVYLVLTTSVKVRKMMILPSLANEQPYLLFLLTMLNHFWSNYHNILRLHISVKKLATPCL